MPRQDRTAPPRTTHMRFAILLASLLRVDTLAQTLNEYDGPTPTAIQLGWQDAELGVLISYELHTFGEGRYVQPRARVTPIDDVDRFHPEQLDTDQWVLAAKAAGARFAILTASHESGFRLWQSDANPYCLSAVKWGDGKRDIVGEFHASCLRHGMLPGIYLGTRWNARLGVFDFRVTERATITQQEYNALIEAEVGEICTRYGDWFEFWFDGGAHGPEQGGPNVLALVERHQPKAVFYHNLQHADARWGGSESGTVPYPRWARFPYPVTGAGESARAEIGRENFRLLKHGDPDGAFWLPAMSDVPLRGRGGHEWFWEPGDEHLLLPVTDLVDRYCRSVGHNSTLILGIAPDTRGLLPDADVQRLAEFGAAVEGLFSRPLAVRSDLPPGRAHELPLEPAGEIALVVLEEDIRHGERVRRYEISARDAGAWRAVAEGSCIGHKRIHRFDPAVRADALRVVVRESEGTPRLARIGAWAAPGASDRATSGKEESPARRRPGDAIAPLSHRSKGNAPHSTSQWNRGERI